MKYAKEYTQILTEGKSEIKGRMYHAAFARYEDVVYLDLRNLEVTSRESEATLFKSREDAIAVLDAFGKRFERWGKPTVTIAEPGARGIIFDIDSKLFKHVARDISYPIEAAKSPKRKRINERISFPSDRTSRDAIISKFAEEKFSAVDIYGYPELKRKIVKLINDGVKIKVKSISAQDSQHLALEWADKFKAAGYKILHIEVNYDSAEILYYKPVSMVNESTAEKRFDAALDKISRSIVNEGASSDNFVVVMYSRDFDDDYYFAGMDVHPTPDIEKAARFNTGSAARKMVVSIRKAGKIFNGFKIDDIYEDFYDDIVSVAKETAARINPSPDPKFKGFKEAQLVSPEDVFASGYTYYRDRGIDSREYRHPKFSAIILYDTPRRKSEGPLPEGKMRVHIIPKTVPRPRRTREEIRRANFVMYD